MNKAADGMKRERMADKNGKRVVVAMSGGVDSSTALAILKDEGYDCIGVSMQLWDYSKKDLLAKAPAGSCCSLDDINDARSVAYKLGVPFYVVNVEEAFSKEVVDYFIKSYTNGQTPNPCVKCNQALKFEVLLRKARSLDADYLATGHYARIIAGGDGSYRLLKGVDKDKDQSYFLFTMTQEQASRVLFPLGGMTKKDVRSYARAAGLRTSEKEESQEICFVEEPSYADFLSSRIAAQKGPIVDASGAVLGEHRGLFNYTIGQRKGLNLTGGPYYVIGLDAASNRLIVGRLNELYSTGLIASDANWISPGLASQKTVTGVDVKIRYRHGGVKSTLRLAGDGAVEVAFSEPQKAVAPGQAAVFYREDEVIGGAWIERAVR